MLRTALELPGPSTIRVPKTAPRHVDPDEVGRGLQARQLRAGDGSVCLLGVGKTVAACLSAADELAGEGIDATVWDVRVVSPARRGHARRRRPPPPGGHGRGRRPPRRRRCLPHRCHGGAGRVGRSRSARDAASSGVPRQYLAQGKADDILASLGLDGAGIAESVRRVRLDVPAEPPLRPISRRPGG